VTTTDWREGIDSRPRWLALGFVLAAGFLLRVFNLGAGIPFAVGIDEPAIMTTVLRILKSGDFNPHFFEYPTGYIYVQLGAAIVAFLVGAMQHSWKAVEHVGPADFYFSARLLSAAVGTATIALVHQAGLRWGARAALVAAGLLAVMPMHVRESHFALTDVPLTFAAALTLLAALRASERPTLKAFVLAGAAAGLTAGVKYNGLMAVSMPLAAAFAIGRDERLTRTVAVTMAAVSCVAAFFVTTPFALLDLPAFLNGFGTQAAAFGPRSDSAEPSWLVYAKHMRLAFGWPASLLCLTGLGLALDRIRTGPDRVRWVLLLAFPATYFYLINGWAFMFARYALPIVPFLALWAGIASVWAARHLASRPMPATLRKAAVAVVMIAVVVPPLIGSVQWVREHGAETTQARAYRWIRANVWPSARIVSEASSFDLPIERYRLFELNRQLAERNPDELIAAGVEYVILSSEAYAWRVRPAAEAAKGGIPSAYASLLARAREVQAFVPAPGISGPELHILRLPAR
jgi:4-amino-4-deoxy-L-arabinose transferase-like glycosyltransferase